MAEEGEREGEEGLEAMSLSVFQPHVPITRGQDTRVRLLSRSVCMDFRPSGSRVTSKSS